MPNTKLTDLKTRLTEVSDLRGANAVLEWDQSTYMPDGGSDARARQMALLGRLAHERFIDPTVGQLLADLESENGTPNGADLSDDAALIRLTRREYDRAVRVPAEFVAEMEEHVSKTYSVWAEARPANDFERVRPLLEKTLELSRRYADFFPDVAHPIDAFIEEGDYGMKATDVQRVFAELRAGLVPLVKQIAAAPQISDEPLRRGYPGDAQLAFGIPLITAFGYDFKRGRQDLTHHPFMTKFGSGDVRITTRFREDDLGDALFGTLHEAGHALYEQGINPEYDGLPLNQGTSNGVHESQSRLWENLVGRSYAFWSHFYPSLQAAFPNQLGNVTLDEFYGAINRVQPSLIRVDADEVTYNLHVMIRFDLEMQMLEGKLAIKDLPEAWNARYTADLGVTPPSNREGCLQDVHWFGGLIGGAFQGYTLGNIMSAQFFNAALKAHPSITDEIGRGEFGTLRGWLTDNIYRHGSKYTADEILHRATGGGLDVNPLLDYLRTKYTALYKLNGES